MKRVAEIIGVGKEFVRHIKNQDYASAISVCDSDMFSVAAYLRCLGNESLQKAYTALSVCGGRGPETAEELLRKYDEQGDVMRMMSSLIKKMPEIFKPSSED
ncbi:MAG: hypothetical protein V1870_04650 [Candidatus Aenigmatarchaeota archaeon]